MYFLYKFFNFWGIPVNNQNNYCTISSKKSLNLLATVGFLQVNKKLFINENIEARQLINFKTN